MKSFASLALAPPQSSPHSSCHSARGSTGPKSKVGEVRTATGVSGAGGWRIWAPEMGWREELGLIGLGATRVKQVDLFWGPLSDGSYSLGAMSGRVADKYLNAAYVGLLN